MDTCTAFLGLTDLPALLEPKKKVGAAEMAFRGLSREWNQPKSGFFKKTPPFAMQIVLHIAIYYGKIEVKGAAMYGHFEFDLENLSRHPW